MAQVFEVTAVHLNSSHHKPKSAARLMTVLGSPPVVPKTEVGSSGR